MREGRPATAGSFKPGPDPRRGDVGARLTAARAAGPDHVRRRSREHVAQIARRIWSVEDSLKWLRELARGVDPDADPDKGHPPVDMATRFAAGCRFMAYSMGLPPQQVQLEGKLAAVIATVEARAGGRTFDQVLAGAGQLEAARRDAQVVVASLRARAAMLAAGEGREPIDADSTEVDASDE